MAEEEKREEEAVDVQKYLDEIQKLKETTVPRKENEKLKAENEALFDKYKSLLEMTVEGKGKMDDEENPEGPTIQELRNKLYGKGSEDLTDLEYIEGTLLLRQKLIDEEGVDPFVPMGRKYSPDANDIYCAQKLAEGFQHCVDVAQGDNTVFLNEITRITKDTAMPVKIKQRR